MEPHRLLRFKPLIWRNGWFPGLRRRMSRYRPWLLVLLLALVLWVLSWDASLKLMAAGISIFLFGMYFLEQGFGQLASSQLKDGLRQLTDRSWKSVGIGLVSTVLTQSSSLIALLTLSFISTGLLSLLSAIGILAGASLGTTTGGWMMASAGLKLDIASYAMPLLVIGMLLISMPRWGVRGGGMVISGIGFLFLGIDYIKNGFQMVSQLVDLNAFQLPGVPGLLVYTLLGLVITLAMQSSHASLLLALAALNAGQLSYDNGLALVIGINVGATAPVLLGALHAAQDGKRLALLDLGFKLVTALVCLLLFIPLRQLNEGLAQLLGMAADNLPLRIALFHTLFNLLAIAWLLPVSQQAAHLLTRWLPDPVVPDNSVHALYLDKVAAAHPAAAEQALLRELLHLFHQQQRLTADGMLGISCNDMLGTASPESLTLGRPRELASVPLLYLQRVKQLYGEILTFAAICKSGMSESQSARIDALLTAGRALIEVCRLERGLQANLISALAGEQPALQAKYRALQLRLLILNRELRQLLVLEEPARVGELLALEEQRVLLDGRRDREDIELLIQGQKLKPLQAATLMNDCQTVRRVQRQLLKACQLMFVSFDVRDLLPDMLTEALYCQLPPRTVEPVSSHPTVEVEAPAAEPAGMTAMVAAAEGVSSLPSREPPDEGSGASQAT